MKFTALTRSGPSQLASSKLPLSIRSEAARLLLILLILPILPEFDLSRLQLRYLSSVVLLSSRVSLLRLSLSAILALSHLV